MANTLAAISVAGAYGISFELMQTALKHMPSIPGRLELIRTFNQRRFSLIMHIRRKRWNRF